MDTDANNTREEPIKLGFFQKRKIRKLLKYSTQIIETIKAKVEKEQQYRQQLEEQILQLTEVMDIWANVIDEKTGQIYEDLIDKKNIGTVTTKECIEIVEESLDMLDRLVNKKR